VITAMRGFIISDEAQKYIESNKPVIAILSPSLDTVPSKSGSAIYCIIEDIAFNSKYPIIVFSKNDKELPPSKIQNRIIYYTLPIQKTSFQKKLGHRLRKMVYGISATEDIRYAKDVYRFCLKHSVKCLVLEDSNSLLAGLPKKPAIHTILHQHANSLINHNKYFYYSFTRRLSEIVFVSELNKLSTFGKYKSSKTPVSTLYNGIDLTDYKLESDFEIGKFRKSLNVSSNSIVLFFAGRINPSKGIRELLLSLNEFKHCDIIVIVAGNLKTSYNYDPEFEEDIKKLCSSKVILLGHVSQAEISKYYAISDFVIVPSIGSEGLPKVITEALVMGKPVIASDRGGTTELVKDGENGIIIEEPVCPESISRAIQKAINNKETLTQIALFHKEWNRSRFSSEQMAKQFDALFAKYV
jgi:glycosyltransferase involved in cell wall biosynthesis